MARAVIGEPFSGFPGHVLGGYLAGVLARELGPRAEVTFRAPLPIGDEVWVEPGEPARLVRAGGQLVAEGVAIEGLAWEAPVVGWDDAVRASGRYPGRRAHLFPRCFCCGPDRDAATGLRIFPGPLGRDGIVAAGWTPPPVFGTVEGTIPAEILWAALDCPAIWALVCAGDPRSVEQAVTGRMALEIRHGVEAGQPHVVVAWPVGREGRKLYAGSAIIADGAVACVARQTMILTERGVPLGLDRWPRESQAPS